MEEKYMSELKEIREVFLADIKEVVRMNKEKVEDAYKRVMRLAHLAHREGLLALDYEAELIPKETPLCNEITEMIYLIVSGTDPKIFEELMTIKFFAIHDYNKIEALLYFLYARSMYMIQMGISSRDIEELFNAVLPKDVLVFDKERTMWKEEKKQKIEDWKDNLTEEEKELLGNMSVRLQELSEEEWKVVIGNNGFYGFDRVLPYLDEKVAVLVKNYMNDYRYYVIMNEPRRVTQQELEELNIELEKVIIRIQGKGKVKRILDDIEKCTDEEIQLLLKNIDTLTLSVALKGARKETAECFYRNLSVRLRYLIQEDMEYMGPVRMCDVEEAESKIIGAAKNVLNWEEVLQR